MKGFEGGESNGRKTVHTHSQPIKVEHNKGPAAKNANRQLEIISNHVYGHFEALKSALYQRIDPFDDIGKAKTSKMRIIIPNVQDGTLDGSIIPCEQNRIHKLVKAMIVF
jgi:hypothetical protein